MTAKLSFRKWLNLEQHKKKILEATESSDFPDRVFAYLSVAFERSANENEAWENSVFSFTEATAEFQPDKTIPLVNAPNNKKEKPADWDYDGRTFAYWAHLLSKSYGWNLEYISALDVNDALKMLQEILTDEQLEKEFYYSLSEVAYPYNPSTKKSVFKPMTRPYWMKPETPTVKKMKFRRDMLPVGAIEDVSGMPDSMNPLRDYVLKKKTKTEKTDASPSP